EPVVASQGPASPAALRLLLARCVALGARVAEPGEFTKRAFLNGKLDLIEAESVADLIDAASATAARAADAARKLAQVRADVERLVARAATGARLGAGLAVVLVGRPNVGKSSL